MRRNRRSAKNTKRQFSGKTPPLDVIVDHIGAKGDGVATGTIRLQYEDQNRPVFIPLSLPGERVSARAQHDLGEGVACQLSEIIEPSPDRVDPTCGHFGACGGCGLQHWAPSPYRQWKRSRIVAALGRAGVEAAEVDALIPAAPGTRRRADFVMRRLSVGTVIGFHERGENRIIDITECPILEPELLTVARSLPPISTDLLAPGESARATLNRLDSGSDLLLVLPREPGLAALESLASLAESLDLCRVSVRTENGGLSAPVVPVLERRPAVIRFAGVEVNPSPGAFLQATASGERAIVQAVLEGVGAPSNIIELHAGCGTLSFPLARLGKIHAVEGDPSATATLEAATRRAGLQNDFSVETRDLMDRPLETSELAAYDALVFDPPRAGARAQAERVAAGGPDRVVAVSCNPATFARDARILVDGGYHLERVTPIDQFLWSAHVELVARFRRGRAA